MASQVKALLVAALLCSLLFQGQGELLNPPSLYCCYGRWFYDCMGGKKFSGDPLTCHQTTIRKCKIAGAALSTPPNEMAAGGGNLGKSNDGAETGAAP